MREKLMENRYDKEVIAGHIRDKIVSMEAKRDTLKEESILRLFLISIKKKKSSYHREKCDHPFPSPLRHFEGCV